MSIKVRTYGETELGALLESIFSIGDQHGRNKNIEIKNACRRGANIKIKEVLKKYSKNEVGECLNSIKKEVEKMSETIEKVDNLLKIIDPEILYETVKEMSENLNEHYEEMKEDLK